MHRRLTALLLAAGILFAACTTASGSINAGTFSDEAGETVRFQDPADPETLLIKGRLVPQRWVNLSFSESGRIAAIQVEEGQSVQAGSVLARLEGTEEDATQVAVARLELLAAEQAFDLMHQNAAVELAEAEHLLAESRDRQDQARWSLKQVKEPASPLQIEQAHANLQLAERGLQKARQDLEKAERLWNKRQDPAWLVLSRREFRLNLAFLSQQVVQAERKYNNAVERYEDLLEPVDEIDLQQAEAELRVAEELVEQAIRERDQLLDGPREDEHSLAKARLSAAEQALQAAGTSLAQWELSAPFSGKVISVVGRAGQWSKSGEVVLVLADLNAWKVEIEELEESEVSRLEVRQPVAIHLDALPDLELGGRVESIGWVYQEVDGEIFYSAEISLSGNPPGLRWGMTARIEPVSTPSIGSSEEDG